jgi:hypothetical protein
MTDHVGAVRTNIAVFASGSMRTTLFERRTPPTQGRNTVLSRAHSRMVASDIITSGRIQKKPGGKKEPVTRPNTLMHDLREIEAAAGVVGQLAVAGPDISIVWHDRSDMAFKGTEYALAIDVKSVVGQVLTAQAACIDTAVKAANAGRPLLRGNEYEPDGNVLHIPFAHVPDDDPLAREEFIGKLQEPSMDISFALQPPEWDLKIRSANV